MKFPLPTEKSKMLPTEQLSTDPDIILLLPPLSCLKCPDLKSKKSLCLLRTRAGRSVQPCQALIRGKFIVNL